MRPGPPPPARHRVPRLQAREHLTRRPRPRSHLGPRPRGRDNRGRHGARPRGYSRLHGARGGRQREVHLLAGLVQLRLPLVRDDRGPGAVPHAQGEGQARRGRQARQGGPGEVLAQVYRRGEESVPGAAEEEPGPEAGLQKRQARRQGSEAAHVLSVPQLEEGRGGNVGAAVRARCKCGVFFSVRMIDVNSCVTARVLMFNQL